MKFPRFKKKHSYQVILDSFVGKNIRIKTVDFLDSDEQGYFAFIYFNIKDGKTNNWLKVAVTANQLKVLREDLNSSWLSKGISNALAGKNFVWEKDSILDLSGAIFNSFKVSKADDFSRLVFNSRSFDYTLTLEFKTKLTSDDFEMYQDCLGKVVSTAVSNEEQYELVFSDQSILKINKHY